MDSTLFDGLLDGVLPTPVDWFPKPLRRHTPHTNPVTDFPNETTYRRGAGTLLSGINLWHDFDWKAVFRHDRSVFPRCKALAAMIEEQCPPGKTPHLILTTLEASEYGQSIRDFENDFAVIINIHHWLQNDKQHDPLGFFLRQMQGSNLALAELQSLQASPAGISAINDVLQTETIAAWIDTHPDQIGPIIDAICSVATDHIGTVDLIRLLQTAKRCGPENVSTFLEWSLQSGSENVLKALERLDVGRLQEVNRLASLASMRRILAIWEENRSNPSEEFWQEQLEQNTVLLSCVFTYPVIILRSKAYVGGKSIGNCGGRITDYLMANELTGHAAIVEIKTPVTRLLHGEYRKIPNASSELVGTCLQVSNQRMNLMHEFHKLAARSRRRFLAIEPPCIIIVGCTDELSEAIESSIGADDLEDDDKVDRVTAFETFRQSLRSVHVITFDELFRKVQVICDTIEGRAVEVSSEPESQQPVSAA